LTRVAQVKRLRLSEASGSLRPTLLQRDLERQKAEFKNRCARLSLAARGQVDGWVSRLAALERIRQTLGYKETLNRGYAVVRGDGDVVTSMAQAKNAAALEIEFQDGRYKIGAAPARKSKTRKTPPDQGSLF